MKKFLLLAVAAGLVSFFGARALSPASSPVSKGGASPGTVSDQSRPAAVARQARVFPGKVGALPDSVAPVEDPFASGVGVCDGFTAADVVPALMEETPYRDRESWTTFLAKNGVGFDALRKTLIPKVIERIASSRRCFQLSDVQETAIGELVVMLESSGADGAVTEVQLRQLQGDPGAAEMVRKCISKEIESQLPIRARNTGPLPWPPYRGTYPKKLALYFGRGVDLYTGAPSD